MTEKNKKNDTAPRAKRFTHIVSSGFHVITWARSLIMTDEAMGRAAPWLGMEVPSVLSRAGT